MVRNSDLTEAHSYETLIPPQHVIFHECVALVTLVFRSGHPLVSCHGCNFMYGSVYQLKGAIINLREKDV